MTRATILNTLDADLKLKSTDNDFSFSSLLGADIFAHGANSRNKFDKDIFYLDTLANIHFTSRKEILKNLIKNDNTINTVGGISTSSHTGYLPIFGQVHWCPNTSINGISAIKLEKIASKVIYKKGISFTYIIPFNDDIVTLVFNRDDIGYGINMNTETLKILDENYGANEISSIEELNAYAGRKLLKKSMVSCVNTAEDNARFFTAKEISRAQKAMLLYRTLGHCGVEKFKEVLRNNAITNCTFGTADFENAIAIHGHPRNFLKGNMKRQHIYINESQLHFTNTTQNLYIDTLYFHGLPHLLCISKPLGMLHTVALPSVSVLDCSSSILKIIDIYKQQKVEINKIFLDPAGAFKSIYKQFVLPAVVEISGVDQHVVDAEIEIKLIKEKMRSIENSLPFYLPDRFITDLVTYATTMTNLLPRMGYPIGARNRFYGETVHVDKLNGEFLSFAQAHVISRKGYNGHESRTNDVLLLRPTFNKNASWEAINIATGEHVTVSHKVVSPYPRDVIEKINKWYLEDVKKKKTIKDDKDAVKLKVKMLNENSNQFHDKSKYQSNLEQKRSNVTTSKILDGSSIDYSVHPLEEINDANLLDEMEMYINDTKVDNAVPIAMHAEQAKNATDPEELEHDDWYSFLSRNQDTNADDMHSYSSMTYDESKVRSLINDELYGYATRIINFHEENNTIEDAYAFRLTLSGAINEGGQAVIEAIDKELEGIILKEVWIYRKLGDFEGIESFKDLKPRPIPSILDLRKKYDAFGNFLKWKARFCAGGHRQDRGDYDEDQLTSPCVMLESIFCLLGFAAEWKALITVVDIGQAYLEAGIGSDIVHMWLNKRVVDSIKKYDKTIDEYIQPDGRVLVQLIKALYGTIQAARCWYDKLKSILLEYDFEQHTNDPCVYMKIVNGAKLVVAFHVDDLLIISQNQNATDKFLKFLLTKVKTIVIHKDKELPYLGMVLTHENDGHYSVNMQAYEEKIFQQFPVTENKRVTSPARDNLFEIAHDEDAELLNEKDRKLYHKVVYMLLFLCKRVRVECLMTISYLASRVTKANKKDLKDLIIVLQFLKNYPNKKIHYIHSASDKVELYVDASFGNCEDYKSRTGVFVMFKGAVVAAYCSKQKIVARNSTESELIGLTDGVTWGLFIRSFVEWIRNNQSKKPVMIEKMIVYQDNSASEILQKTGQRNNIRTRHLGVRYFWAREQIQLGLIDIIHVATKLMLADIGTKPLHGKLFHNLWTILIGEPQNKVI